MGISISEHGVSYGYEKLTKYMRELQDEIIYGGHVTALEAPIYVLFAATLLGVHASLPMLLIGYMSALIVYSVDYHGSTKSDIGINHGRTSYYLRTSRTYRYRILAYTVILALALILSGSLALIPVILALALLGVAYSAIFKNFTKYIPGFKNIFTAGIWATGPVSVVLACTTAKVGTEVLLIYVFLFMRSFGNVIYFDVKDIESDKAEGLKTLPVMLGRDRTFVLLGILNVASFLPLIVGVWMGILPPLALSIIAIAVFTFYYLKKARAMPYNYLNYMLADVETFLWPPVLLIAGGILAL